MVLRRYGIARVVNETCRIDTLGGGNCVENK